MQVFLSSAAALTPEMVKPAALTGANAFIDDPTTRHLIPNPKKRRNFHHAIECYLRLSLLNHTECYVTSPRCEGLVVWVRSDAPSRMINTFRAGWPWRPLRCGWTYFFRDTRVTLHYERLRKEIAPKPHLYLALLAVAPEHRRQGFASQLIRPVLARLDADNLPAYLETQNKRNVAMYERYGFHLIQEDIFPGTSITMYLMVRPPAIFL